MKSISRTTNRLLLVAVVLATACGHAPPDGVAKGDLIAPAFHNPPGTRMPQEPPIHRR